MATQPINIPYLCKRCFMAALLCVSFGNSFCQTNNSTDSSKTNKQPNTGAGVHSSRTYGSGRLVLLGHARKIPLAALQDADGDGVPDQLDLEPNTPHGAEVDSHGRAIDTDGDGVPDYRDKEKLTPQSCFPVDSNGVGKCPEPACCKEAHQKLRDVQDDDIIGDHRSCTLDSLPSIIFSKGSKLSENAMKLLADVAGELQSHPLCNARIIGYHGGPPTEKSQQLSWDRVHAIIKYLVEKHGISGTRFIFVYGQYGNYNTVDLIPTVEYNPSIPPSPSPRHY